MNANERTDKYHLNDKGLLVDADGILVAHGEVTEDEVDEMLEWLKGQK